MFSDEMPGFSNSWVVFTNCCGLWNLVIDGVMYSEAPASFDSSISSPTVDVMKGGEAESTVVFEVKENSNLSQGNLVYDRNLQQSLTMQRINHYDQNLIELNKSQETIKTKDNINNRDSDPMNFNYWFDKGNDLSDLGKYNEAIKAYDKASEINPKNAKVWDNKGDALSHLSKYDEAITAYDKSLEIQPNNIEAWSGKQRISTTRKPSIFKDPLVTAIIGGMVGAVVIPVVNILKNHKRKIQEKK